MNNLMFLDNSYSGASVSIATINLSASTEVAGYIFFVKEDCVIDRLLLPMTGSIGTTPNYIIALEGVTDGTGYPNGTIKGGGSPASTIFNPTTNGWSGAQYHWVTLDNAYSASAGELLCYTIRYSSGTINSSNRITVALGVPNIFSNISIPYCARYLTSSWSSLNNYIVVYGYGSSTNKYGNTIYSISSWSYNSSSNPNEHGNKITIPDNRIKYTLCGLHLSGITFGTTENFDICIYNGGEVTDTTPLYTTSIDVSNFVSNSVDKPFIYFTPQILTPGSYRISLKPTTTNSITQISFNTYTNDDLLLLTNGQVYNRCSRNAGNWTDVTTGVQIFYPIFKLDAPSFRKSSNLHAIEYGA